MLAFVIASAGCSTWPSKKAQPSRTPASNEPVVMPADANDYRLGPDDVLTISVWKNPELTGEVIVRPDGKISFPLVGEVMAGGRTVRDIEIELTEKVSEYIPGVNLTVMLNQANNYKIYIIGQVPRPGEYRMGKTINVIQALSLAGGLATFARSDEILILRTKGNHQEKIPFSYDEVKRGKKLEQNIHLQPGDVVVVP
ncbi:MAG: polysaccharide biosynthesis/export family protein [Thermodesulfobacteriota bacterium]|nr:polysaccharide biosynthesis/export family protein [Thermodesulfobacteriota bacterium]